MSKVIRVSINVKQIDKAKLITGTKGTYLDAVIFLNDQPDKYENWGMICQSSKQNEPKGAILGNVKMKEKLYSKDDVLKMIEDVKQQPKNASPDIAGNDNDNDSDESLHF